MHLGMFYPYTSILPTISMKKIKVDLYRCIWICIRKGKYYLHFLMQIWLCKDPYESLWDGVYSDWFNITAGVRQGGVLSPDLYSIYVNELIYILQKAGIGCYFCGIFAASLFYADNMALLAPFVKGLQRLLDLCHDYCVEWDILLNARKTKNMMFGKGSYPSYSTIVNGVSVPWVDQWKYLGVTLIVELSLAAV